ncbi:MAG TPA: tRNA (adenosine(37)-N6)-threonylcarbamoyltransferase complex dimerization subunit type 1 TsaB [Acidobacteriaceae bacterium]
MVILSIDTCGPSGTVALARLDGAPNPDSQIELLGETGLPGKTYSAQLMPSIRDLLAGHAVTIADLATFVITSGPGSFTGIRVGLSTAKGLAEANRAHVLAVSRLAVLAHKARTHAAALDASRREYYFGDFSGDPTSELLLSREPFLERAAALGSNLAVCEEVVSALAPSATVVQAPTAVDAIRFALPRLRRAAFDDPITLDGNYLRRSDAEIFSKPQSAASRP